MKSLKLFKGVTLTILIDRITIENWTLCAAWILITGAMIAIACSLV